MNNPSRADVSVILTPVVVHAREPNVSVPEVGAWVVPVTAVVKVVPPLLNPDVPEGAFAVQPA